VNFRSDLEALILSVLRDGPAHGYEIARRIRSGSADVLAAGENRLYPALKAIEEAGLVDSHWESQGLPRPRKVYGITESGLRELEVRRSAWVKFSAGVSALLQGSGPLEGERG
jgi:PadR family transcriptional regulator, regulatory protein PadR